MAIEVAKLAWAAGLFEGEGCFSFNGRGHHTPKMMVVTSDLDVLQSFAAIAGCGTIGERRQRIEHHKRAWEWKVHGRVAFAFFMQIRPWLHQRRRERGDEVFSYLQTGRPFSEISADGTQKSCSGCREFKPFADFSRSRHGVLGLESRCRVCRQAKHRAYYVRNLEENRRKRRDYMRKRRAEPSLLR